MKKDNSITVVVEYPSDRKSEIAEFVSKNDLPVYKNTCHERIASKLERFSARGHKLAKSHLGSGNNISLIELAYGLERGLISESNISDDAINDYDLIKRTVENL